MKGWLSLVAIVVLCLALVLGIACGGEEEEEEGVTELKAGIGIPLTGGLGAAVGLPVKYGDTMVAEDLGEFTVGGKQYRWNVIFEDNLMSVAGGVAAANKFIYEHDVDIMLMCGAGASQAAMPICEELGILLDNAAGRPRDLGPDTPHTFMVCPSWELNIPPFFDWLSKEHPELKRVVYAVSDDETGDLQAEAVSAGAEHYGFEVSGEVYATGTLEYMPVATKIMSKNPDVFIGYPVIYELMKAMGYKGMAVCLFWTESGAEQAGWNVCEGYLVLMPNPIGDLWPEVTAFAAEFEDRYGLEFNPAAFWASTGLYTYTDAMRKAGTVDDTERIIEVLETEAFDTPVGPLRFGGEVLNGIGHIMVWPTPILEVVGERQYRTVACYTPEETEAIANAIYAGE